MSKKTAVVPLATALAALTTGAHATAPSATPSDTGSNPVDSQQATPTNVQPNTVFTAGEDLLGLLVTQNADGSVVAQHGSHVSHASHASHSSSR
jgi:hypothetical protein